MIYVYGLLGIMCGEVLKSIDFELNKYKQSNKLLALKVSGLIGILIAVALGLSM